MSKNQARPRSLQFSRTSLSDQLIGTSLFKEPSTTSAVQSYERARAIGLVYGITRSDIAQTTRKFWELHTDPITCFDGAATTLLTIQYNLVVGTLIKYESDSDHQLPALVDELLTFKTIGQFCLTEIDHGLDAFNIETVATELGNDGFELHTPHLGASKFMPPTIPVLGRRCVAIVFARLISGAHDLGPRPFLVPINDGVRMEPGITARLLPPRGGSHLVNHAITNFFRVRLPRSALLGGKPSSPTSKSQFTQMIWRVAVGSLALGSISVPGLRISAIIGAKYGLRRQVTGYDGKRTPILSFATQQIAVFTAISHAFVVKALSEHITTVFSDESVDAHVRHSLAACSKVVMVQHFRSVLHEVSERCGAQGLFAHNQMSNHYSELRGISIAEGDILGLSIRVVADLLQKKCCPPSPSDPDSLLAKHECALLEQATLLLARSNNIPHAFSRHVLPMCQAIAEAIGHRLAYDAAIELAVPQCLIDLYVCRVIELDFAWYIETGMVTREVWADLREKSLEAIQGGLPQLLDTLEMDFHVNAPIISDVAWIQFCDSLPCHSHL